MHFPHSPDTESSTETGGVASKQRTQDDGVIEELQKVVALLSLQLKQTEIITDTELDSSDVAGGYVL